MTAGILLLGFAYILSQFFRAFLAVLSPFLRTDIGAGPEALADASGLWFITFAAMQIPIGWALDTLGPRRTAATLLLLGGGGGAAVFALATAPVHVSIAMALIGIGCAPVLMASYYIFARDYPPARFAALAAIMVGVGTSGNVFASFPVAYAAETFGWRFSLWGLAALTTLTAIGIWLFVNDPAKPEGEEGGSFLGVFRIRALWFIFPLMAVSYAWIGAYRGLWIGPYLEDVFAASPSAIGWVTFAMGLAMIAGTFAYGPMDRILGTRKWLIAGGSIIMLAVTVAMAILPAQSFLLIAVLAVALGFFGMTYPQIMAHGRAFLPQHLVGRGITMLNLCSIGGVGVMQFVSGRVYEAVTPAATPQGPYVILFVLFSALLAAGIVIYLFSTDNTG